LSIDWLLLSQDFEAGHFKKNEISFRALKSPPAHHGGQAVRSPEFAADTPNSEVFASMELSRAGSRLYSLAL
jgi:hypothetical protein